MYNGASYRLDARALFLADHRGVRPTSMHGADSVPTTLPEFCCRFSTEEACAGYLFHIRWPDGFVCPRCGTKQGYEIKTRGTIECANPGCKYHASLTAGTVMHRSKQNLVTWFWAAYLVTTLTPGISATQFQKQLGLSRYETAFNMLHKLRAALVAPNRDPLHAEVEVDEAYIGGVETGLPGRGVKKKALVVCAVELVRWIDKKSCEDRVRAGRVRLRTIPDASSTSLVPFVKESIKKGAIVHTDGWPSYSSLREEGYDHRILVRKRIKNTKLMPHVHRIISNLKEWLRGTHHGGVQMKHLQAYLNEYTYRFNRRFWRGPAFNHALGLATNPADWPTYERLYNAGEPDAWIHPYAHGHPEQSDSLYDVVQNEDSCPETTG